MYYYTKNGVYCVLGLNKEGEFVSDRANWVKFAESEKLSMGFSKPYNAKEYGDFVPCQHYY